MGLRAERTKPGVNVRISKGTAVAVTDHIRYKQFKILIRAQAQARTRARARARARGLSSGEHLPNEKLGG